MGSGFCKDGPAPYRAIPITGNCTKGYPNNALTNTKYNIITFIPKVLYNQFKYFFNMYFLCISLSQFIPELQVGFLITYVLPLSFVLCVTMCKEAVEDVNRW
jgi:phospholipid-translocating ATPase